MFPIKSSDAYIKDNGKRSTIGAEIGGGGGSDLPEYSQADAGRVLTVGEDGELEWTESGSGGGVTVLSGYTDPTALIGNNGDIYCKCRALPVLPEGYAVLDKLQVGSTSGPNLLTNIVLTSTSEYEIDFKFDDTPTNNVGVFGNFESGKQSNVICTGGRIYAQVGGSNANIALDLNRHIIKATQTNFVIDGDVVAGSPNWSNLSSNPIRVFWTGDANKADNLSVFGLKIWDNGELSANLVPCKNVSDVLGMYDVINDEFYSNVGSGSFSGNVLTGEPILAAYLKVNSVWSDLIGSNFNDIGES